LDLTCRVRFHQRGGANTNGLDRDKAVEAYRDRVWKMRKEKKEKEKKSKNEKTKTPKKIRISKS
jgi:hypothetical protein